MNTWSLVHIGFAFASLVVGLVMLGLRKGDPRHKLLGWIYVATMSAGLAGILVRTSGDRRPFAFYAILMLAVLAAAVAAIRARRRMPSGRAWHGALMSMTLMGSIMAALSIGGGVAIGASAGPPFYRLFNAIIVVVTLAAMAVIVSSAVIFGRPARAELAAARLGFGALVVASSAALVLAQWPLAFP